MRAAFNLASWWEVARRKEYRGREEGRKWRERLGVSGRQPQGAEGFGGGSPQDAVRSGKRQPPEKYKGLGAASPLANASFPEDGSKPFPKTSLWENANQDASIESSLSNNYFIHKMKKQLERLLDSLGSCIPYIYIVFI